jgi:hypothetical protein
MKNAIFLVIAVAAIGSLTAVLSSTSAFAINNAQDDKNNPTFPGCGVGTGTCESNQAQQNNFNNCDKHGVDSPGEVGNGQNLPAQCY